MRKATDVFLLLQKTNRLTLPDPDGSGAEIILYFLKFFSDFIQGLIPGYFNEITVWLPLQWL